MFVLLKQLAFIFVLVFLNLSEVGKYLENLFLIFEKYPSDIFFDKLKKNVDSIFSCNIFIFFSLNDTILLKIFCFKEFGRCLLEKYVKKGKISSFQPHPWKWCYDSNKKKLLKGKIIFGHCRGHDTIIIFFFILKFLWATRRFTVKKLLF